MQSAIGGEGHIPVNNRSRTERRSQQPMGPNCERGIVDYGQRRGLEIRQCPRQTSLLLEAPPREKCLSSIESERKLPIHLFLSSVLGRYTAILLMKTGNSKKNPHAIALSRLGAEKGGRTRAKNLTPERRSEIARKAAKARWRRRESETP